MSDDERGEGIANAPHSAELPPGVAIAQQWSAEEPSRGLTFSTDGTLLAAAQDNQIALWNWHTGQVQQVFEANSGDVLYQPSFSVDDGLVAAPSYEGVVWVWSTVTGEVVQSLAGHDGAVCAAQLSPDGAYVVSGGFDDAVRVFDVASGKERATLLGHEGDVEALALVDDDRVLTTSDSSGHNLKLWRTSSGEELADFETATASGLLQLAVAPDVSLAAVSTREGEIEVWDYARGQHVVSLQGHTEAVTGLSFSPDRRLLASKSRDGTLRIWRCDQWRAVATLDESHWDTMYTSIAFHPHENLLASSDHQLQIRIWRLDADVLAESEAPAGTVHYTTAKIALVGDSGVGKTTLGWRLVFDDFALHESTHGQQFWVVDRLSTTRADGVECEAVLWDLAGQTEYRLVHTIFLDDLDVALVLFDASNQGDQLRGVEYWLGQLKLAARRPRLLLVGSRCDRGSPGITAEELADYCERREITGGFVLTSARSGEGMQQLVQALAALLPWDDLPFTVTTQTFRRIKARLLELKAAPANESVILRREELEPMVRAADPELAFTEEELHACAALLSNHGYLTVLDSSSGSKYYLLAPDLLVNLAASFVLEARRNPEGLGALDEAAVLGGDYPFPELEGIEPDDAHVLLDATATLFVRKHLCFRETLGGRAFLIFPSLVNQKRPSDGSAEETVDDMTYVITGAVEHVYPALVVLLGYTNTFRRTNQWQHHAQYELEPGQICGFRQVAERDGELEIVLYYGETTPEWARSAFRGLFEGFLRRRDVRVRRFPVLTCSSCGLRQERSTVVRRAREQRTFLVCEECGTRLDMPSDEDGDGAAVEPKAVNAQRQAALERSTYEAALVRIKALALERGLSAPSCFLSYAWGEPDHHVWMRDLATDLREAGVDVVFDEWANAAIGSSIGRFVERLAEVERIVVVGTSGYKRKYENRDADAGTVVAAEIDVIHVRLTGTEAQKKSVLPLLREGTPGESLPPLLQGRVYGDFRQESSYLPSLFDLVLTLYGIPFDDPGVVKLRALGRGQAD